MVRVMYDGVTASRVPSDGWGVAGYVNGSWPSYQALVNRFPHLAHISITVNAQGTALVLDVEDKDATPQQAPGWVQRMRAKGIPYPVVYMNASAWQSVKNEFAAQGVRPPLYWVAKYDGVAVVPAGAIAKQHTNTAGYDVSAVADYWPGVDPAPEPTVIHHAKEHAMLIIRSITGSDQIWGQVGDRYWHIASSSDLNAYRAACVKAGVPVVELNVSAAEHANLQAA